MQQYYVIFIFLAIGIFFVAGGLFTSRLLRPNRPNPEKLTTYESGEDPSHSAWGNFNVRFYVIALIFILFEAEIVFLFPWASIFANENLINMTNGLWGWFSFFEVSIFIAILGLGLAFVWRKGYLDWDKPQVIIPKSNSKIPKSFYDEVNKKYS
jgi:NADH-quinone oxidoreductase subunit A